VKALLGFRAKARNVIEGDEGYQLREAAAHYKALFRAEKDDIAPENSYFWDMNAEQSTPWSGPSLGRSGIEALARRYVNIRPSRHDSSL
jgi:hypothetical protein